MCVESLAEPRGSTPTDPPGVPEFQPQQYEALFAYASEEPGDLVFEAGEIIEVLKMEAEWWTGRIGQDRTGVFPFNYVKQVSAGGATANGAEAAEPTPAVSSTFGFKESTNIQSGPHKGRQLQPLQKASFYNQMNSNTAFFYKNIYLMLKIIFRRYFLL